MTSLKKKSAVALAWDLFGNYGGQIIAFVISIFLARLLEPEEFGLVGMSMVFINILKIFMDFGFAAALINNQQNTSLTYSSVFYLNVAFGGVITIIIYFVAPWVGMFFDSEIVTILVRLLSISFFISSFNIVQGTILKNELNFKSLTYRDLIAQIGAGLVAVYCAWAGYGVYALVVQFILAEIIKTILLWKITGWYPKWEFSKSEIKSLFGFSFYIVASQSMGQVVKQLDTLAVGKLFNPALLGFYSRAKSINTLINKNSSSLQKVFFPVLSKVQDEEERFKKIYLRLLDLSASISMLLVGVFFLAGEGLIIGLFGEKWAPSVPIFKILILKGFTYPINSIVIAAFLAKGKSKENFHYGNIRKVLQLVPLLIAYLWGFDAFLYSMVVVSLICWLLNNYFSVRSLHVGYPAQFKAVLPYIGLGATLIFFIDFLLPSHFNYLLILVKAGLYGVIYIVILYLTNSILMTEAKFYFTKLWQKLKVKLSKG